MIDSSLRQKLEVLVASLRDVPGLTLHELDVPPPPPSSLISAAEQAYGAQLPVDLMTIYRECDGFQIVWSARGRWAELQVMRFAHALGGFGAAPAWMGPAAFQDQLWNDMFLYRHHRDHDPQAALERIKQHRLLSSSSGGDGQVVTMLLQPGLPTALFTGETNDLLPLTCGIEEYLDFGIGCGGLRFAPALLQNEELRAAGRVELRDDMLAALPGWPLPAGV